jgi:hypothetical protein
MRSSPGPRLCSMRGCRTRLKPGREQCATHEYLTKRREADKRRKEQRALAVELPQQPLMPAVQLANPRHHALCSRIAAELGQSLQQVVYGGRTPSVVRARFACYYALRQCELSLTEIGDVLGFHHTTVMSGIRKVEREIKRRPDGLLANALKLSLTGIVSDKAAKLRRTIAELQTELGALEIEMEAAE